ncbi:molybdopterin/thiamine biosynthesis adenylyltransferase [Actinomycetospora succinea]|uniref:Molybdopterin/thiamine biosynthesis adenylyltransferase n=1 Tax=Actinomycetospora succinea TaxID=663603 RepID=A0A4R6VDS5_9PSEU|nr:ThiF family adenylyltransferase [Actinomycetospora succinea]TDQ58550.1 molybdopterin/thiamine biosynthesis adenylyltransferase [Actinomycetospora succinea]
MLLTDAVPLPARPRLRLPALHRSADVLQFGAGPSDALVVDGLTPPLVRMVEALDGTRPLARVLADAVAAGASPGAARALLDHLDAAGLLADPAVPPLGRRVVVRGAGRVAVSVACLLATAGVGRVLVEAAGTVSRDDLGTGLVADDVGRPAERAAEEAVARAGASAPGPPAARRWLSARADLVVLADGARPDPLSAQRLVLDGRAHLPVAAVDGAGTVGPLVVPGATPCLRCDDLGRADADDAWPRVAAELVGRRDPAPVALAASTAALAVGEVLGFLDDGPPASRGAVLTLAPDGVRRVRPVRRHPECGCAGLAGRRARATGGVEVTPAATLLVTGTPGPTTAGAA